MKKLIVLISLLFLFRGSYSQSGYSFNISVDTAIESNAYVIAGYVKADVAPTFADSVVIVLKSGSPRPTHMDTTSRYVVNFNIGQDSVPFVIHISSDTFPEYPEHVQYVLSSPVNGSTINADSVLLFVLRDTTPPAIISYLVDSAWAYESTDSFYQGVYVPQGSIPAIGITVNNPNPFFVRFIADNFDCYHSATYPGVNACALVDYYYNRETLYAPPGISTIYKLAYLVPENSSRDKYFYCNLSNIDANVITDSLTFFTIRHTNFFNTPALSFDQSSVTVVADSFQKVGIPITIVNPNMKPLYFHIDTIQNSSSYPGINYTFNNQEYGYGHGISHDTFWVSFINTHLPGDTIIAVFALRNDSVNSSPDTLFRMMVIDTGSLNISFLGAALAHLKSDSIGYVKVFNSSFAKFPISVKVSYLNGNAIRDTDFIFNDTTVVFPPFTFDTIALPVIMLQDHRYQGNTQVNLQLTDVNPSNIEYGITQYTFTIIDDVDSGLTPLGVQPVSANQLIKVHPNPFDNDITIETALPVYNIRISNSIGEEVYSRDRQKGTTRVDLAGQPAGLYLIRVSDGDISYVRKVLKL